MFSKRKERSGWGFEKRFRNGCKASKEVTNFSSNSKMSKDVTNSSNYASKGDHHRSRKSVGGNCGRHPGRRSPSSNSESNDKSRIRTRRRKRRRMRARENQEGNDGFKSQKKQGHRKTKPKRNTRKVIWESSESS